MGESMILYLALAIASAAALYSSVGHGGASAYIALMALNGLAPAEIRPAALVLNILVAGLGAIRYLRAQRFDWDVFWPFAVTAIPASFLAGRIAFPLNDRQLFGPRAVGRRPAGRRRTGSISCAIS